jgi:serine/threonine protein kinase
MSKIKVLDRFKNYKLLNEIIKEKIENAKNKCLVPIDKDTYSLNNTIILLKRIGSDSSYGSIFLSVIKKHSKVKFITKIQLNTPYAIKEINYLLLLTKYAIIHKNIHLPIMYNSINCDSFNKKDNKLPDNIIDYKYNINSYSSIFVELAVGDLSSLFKSNINITYNLINNIIAQCLVGILTLHNLNIIHNDTHLGNFLYHKIVKKGCFKYIYKDLIFYIENIGYNWVIWDFGLSKSITPSLDYLKYIKKDYKIFMQEIIKRLLRLGLYDFDNIKMVFNYILYDLEDDYLLFKLLLKHNILISKSPIGSVITTIKL